MPVSGKDADKLKAQSAGADFAKVPPDKRVRLHHFLAFTGAPGLVIRNLVAPERIRRMNHPANPGEEPGWTSSRANNYGFFSDRDYPFVPPDREKFFIVGVFGGSVAHWFALLAGLSLGRGIDADDRANGRETIILNFAAGGMKQPQTLLALNFFLAEGQEFDAVVVLDGFNDAALSYANVEEGYQAGAPSIWHLRQAAAAIPEPEMGRHDSALSENDIVTDIVQRWSRAARLMQEVCRSRGIAIVHALQPNQYCSQKVFSSDEREYALPGTAVYRRGVTAVYPRLKHECRKLQSDGYFIVDASCEFDDIVETVFIDAISHFNMRGNRRLVELLLRSLLPII